MQTKYLSKDERERGTKYYFRWAIFNGLGFSFLGDTIVYLIAIHFGASNTQLGYIASIIHVSGLTSLFLPQLLSGTNLIKAQFYAWLLRGLICCLYGLLLFCEGQVAVMFILVTYTLFCLFRTVGIAVEGPIRRMLASSATVGELVVRISNRFQTMRVISQFLSFLLLSIQQLTGTVGYLVLITIGISMNTLAAFTVRNVPCRETIEFRRGGNIFAMFARSIRDRERALTLFVKWHTIGMMVLFPFMIPFLRKIVQIPPNIIFLFTVACTVAMALSGYLLQPFADRVGSRPLITIAACLLAGLGVVWGTIPAAAPWPIFFGLGFLTYFLMWSVLLLALRLELRSLPEKDKMSYVSMINFFSAIMPLVVGLSGGMLADLGEQIQFPGLNPFGLTFLLAAAVSLQNGILCFFLEDAGSWSVKDTAAVLLSTRNLKSFLDIYQLNITDDRAKRTFILMSLGKSDTSLAADEIQHILRNPLSTEKEEVLKTLFLHPKPALLPDILREAADPQSYHRITALFALGAYPDARVETLLLNCLADSSPLVQSSAAKSLARIGNTTALPRIRALADEPSLGVSERMNYLIALSLMDRDGRYLADLFQIADHNKGATFEQTMFSLAAKMLGLDPILADLYQTENLARNTGMQDFLEEAKQLQPFYDHADTLAADYAHDRYAAIWAWCRDVLHEYPLSGPFRALKQAILEHDQHGLSQANTLAALYFTYQVLQAYTETEQHQHSVSA